MCWRWTRARHSPAASPPFPGAGSRCNVSILGDRVTFSQSPSQGRGLPPTPHSRSCFTRGAALSLGSVGARAAAGGGRAVARGRGQATEATRPLPPGAALGPRSSKPSESAFVWTDENEWRERSEGVLTSEVSKTILCSFAAL